ncbi:alpha/beta-type small acid-soluble spore protein [Effusibacillus pohliae]|uniref:alpha/beta-type small acid-soluble spore protein n=1 Tax=Effusibacillus pohliae TaxID=232270 RepID=UPI00037B79EA|nr:alpha/beta-type small acid-soluble spore protein [Effusibacillus pohliae]
MARRRNRLLVPEAKEALDCLKCQVIQENTADPNVSCTVNPNDAKYTVAKQVGVPLAKGDNGELTARQAGKVGGRLGGSMVRRLVELAQQQLSEQGQS